MTQQQIKFRHDWGEVIKHELDLACVDGTTAISADMLFWRSCRAKVLPSGAPKGTNAVYVLRRSYFDEIIAELPAEYQAKIC